MAEPLSHKLFQEYTPTQMHPEGLKRLIACYPDGLKRIKEVYRQDVLRIEQRNTKGRRAVGVVRMKLKDYNDQKKTKRKRTVNQPSTNPIESEQAENSNQVQPVNEPLIEYLPEPQSKRRKVAGTKYRTTEDEMAILSILKVYKDKLPVNVIASVRKQLSEVWTIKKVRDWWNYHKDK
ncbi:hypothetical protein Glove_134g158 [Diversispora epigaea]|uniref:Uncharacterized protein n=1 Tax=Diversispora epigaea TaxID=1348612 RepID=A0A397J1K5_9GLOM|nr:hypothetical protein Glove_134g158 [Diversispora epigaea]